MSWEKDHFAEVLKKSPKTETDLRNRLAELIANRDCSEHKEAWRNERYVYGDTLVHCTCGRHCWASEAKRPDQECYWNFDDEHEERLHAEIEALEEHLAELSGTYAI